MSDLDLQQDREIFRGEDTNFEIDVVDQYGDAQDITGWSFTLTVRTEVGAAAASITKSSFTITDAAGGQGYFDLDAADTESLDTGAYWYDVWGQDSGGDDHPLVRPSVLRITERVRA